MTGQDLDSAWGDPLFNDPERFEFIPLRASIWYEQKTWPVRKLTDAEIAAAREKYLSPAAKSADGSE